MCSSPPTFHPIVTEMLTRFENQSFHDLDWVEKSAELLISNDDRETAQKLLTHYSHTRAEQALDLGATMANALNAYIKLSGQGRNPIGDQINDAGDGAETVNCLVGFDPDKPPDQQALRPRTRSYLRQQRIER
jgi:hypothetical protein